MDTSSGCYKCHHYVYGRKDVIGTDHRPLIAVESKGIGGMLPQLQHSFLHLPMYDCTLLFIPGNELVLADMLPRPLSIKTEDTASFTGDVEVHVMSVIPDMHGKQGNISLPPSKER